MRRILLLVLLQFGLLAGGRLFADVVTLKDGRQISGVVESGNTQELHIKVGDKSQTVDIDQLRAIQFGAPTPAPAAAPKKADGRSGHRLPPGVAVPLLGLVVCLAAAAWNGSKDSERRRP